jgi:hypothetical protein
MAAFPTEEVIQYQYTSDEVSYASPYSFPQQTPFQLDYSFWPNVRHYLKSSFPKPGVSDPMCRLCTQPMHIPHLSPYLNEGGSNVADPNLQAVVLPCGHIYHSDCFDKLDRSYEERGLYTMCPTCNLQMRYTHANFCTHRLQALSLGDDSNPSAVPLTIPEGGTMPFACPTCRVGLANHYLQQIQCVLVGPTSAMMDDPWAGPEPEFVHCWNNRAAFAGSLVNSFRAML